MSKPTSFYLWTAAAVVVAVGGAGYGNTLRVRHDGGDGLIAQSALYASNQDSGNATIAEGIPARQYFDEVRRVILDEFVEPVSNETPLARGALQFMLQELGDPSSRYYSPAQWAAYVDMFEGHYSGIGADLSVREEQTPEGSILPIKVVSLVDGGPASTAGLKQGDWIDEIDGKWIASRSLWVEVEKASGKLTKKQITREQFDQIVEQLQKKSEKLITIFPALEELQAMTGPVKLKVRRGDEKLDFTIVRKKFDVVPIGAEGSTIRIRSFSKSAANELAALVKGKNSVVLDVRGNPGGSFTSMAACLAELCPNGVYGMQQKDPKHQPQKLVLEGTSAPPRLSVIVDRGTAREAELFVAALRDLAGAEIKGPPTFGLGQRIERFALADGSGYTITSAYLLDTHGNSLVRSKPASKVEKGALSQPRIPERLKR
ncbi:MAG: S41 family peptidase [Fimbriimonadales bacterium]